MEDESDEDQFYEELEHIFNVLQDIKFVTGYFNAEVRKSWARTVVGKPQLT
jgi:hypothetical protein